MSRIVTDGPPMNLTVSEYRTLIASEAQDIAAIARDHSGYVGPALSSALPVMIDRLRQLSDGYAEAVKEDKGGA